MNKQKNYRIVITTILIIFLIMLSLFCHVKTAEISYANLAQSGTTVPAQELTQAVIYQQEIPCSFEKIKEVGFHFANYSDRENKGLVSIQVLLDNDVIGEESIDASQIRDGEYYYVRLNRTPQIGEKITARISSNSKTGQGVTIWSSSNEYLNSQGSTLAINGVVQNTQLEYKFILNQANPKLSIWFIPLLGVGIFLYFLTGVPQYYIAYFQTRYCTKRIIFYIGLLVIGMVILCLRNMDFITTPIIYGEDGWFLSRQLNNGLLQGLFSTRGGDSADFSQTSAYLLTWLAAKTTAILHGYSLAEYPLWMGIYGNMSFAFAGIIMYRAFELLIDRKTAFVAYAAVILMNLGNTSSEVLGRILNTGFLWTVIVAAALMIRYMRYDKYDLESVIEDILCFIGAFTFPICFLEIGIYLVFQILRNWEDKKIYIRKNILQFMTFVLGVIMLPRLLTSAGGGVNLTTKWDSMVEFFIARHFLFPFIWPFYHKLTDSIVIALFLIYAIVVLWAALLSVKKHGVTNAFVLYAALTVSVCGASAYMRRTMSALFADYSSTYPDRYYYACNILALMLGVVAILIIINGSKLQKKKPSIIFLVTVTYMCCNPYLLSFTYGNYAPVLGGEYKGSLVDNCKESIQKQRMSEKANNLVVDIYPNGWTMDMPLQYALATAEDSNIR